MQFMIKLHPYQSYSLVRGACTHLKKSKTLKYYHNISSPTPTETWKYHVLAEMFKKYILYDKGLKSKARNQLTKRSISHYKFKHLQKCIILLMLIIHIQQTLSIPFLTSHKFIYVAHVQFIAFPIQIILHYLFIYSKNNP